MSYDDERAAPLWFMRLRETTGEWGAWRQCSAANVEDIRKHVRTQIYEVQQFVPAPPTLPHPALDRANAGERESEGVDLHAAIMNLPCKVPSSLVADVTREHFILPQDPVVRAYRIGHRDARHAAAEAVLAALPAADPERREGAEGVALPDVIEKLRRCTLGCGAFGQCKATMHGKPSECAAGIPAPIPHTFAPPDADTGDRTDGGKNG